jgi:hypothetical protein
MIKVTTRKGEICLEDEYDLLVGLTREEAAKLMLDLATALGHNKLTFGTAPEVPPDPALILAQRIASISAETGLKPRLVLSIINELRWDAEVAAEKAQEAAAPQENQTDD